MSAVILSPARSEPRARPLRPGSSLLTLWLHRLRARRALAALDAGQIREAGLDPYRVRAEILKPVWRA